MPISDLSGERWTIDDPKNRARYDLECTFINDYNKIKSKITLEKKFVNFSRNLRYVTNFAKWSMTLLPLAAYINPDYNGMEHLVAGLIATITIPGVIGLYHFVPTEGIKKTENEYQRRVSVLEERLRELEREVK